MSIKKEHSVIIKYFYLKKHIFGELHKRLPVYISVSIDLPWKPLGVIGETIFSPIRLVGNCVVLPYTSTVFYIFLVDCLH